MEEVHANRMMTCAISANGEAVDFELLLDPTSSPAKETCTINGKGYVCTRFARKLDGGTMEYRVFMIEDALLSKPHETRADYALKHWSRGFQVPQWHP